MSDGAAGGGRSARAVEEWSPASAGLTYPRGLRCAACGYELTGLGLRSACPECGHVNELVVAVKPIPRSTDPIAAAVLGLVTLVSAPCAGPFAVIPGVFAVVLASVPPRDPRRPRTALRVAGAIGGVAGAGLGVVAGEWLW